MNKIAKYFIILLCFSIYSCKKDKEVPMLSDTATNLLDTVFFKRNIIPIFINNCNNSGCHTGSIPSSRIKLDSTDAYNQLMKSGSGYVDTLYPTNSVIYVSLTSVSRPMPPNIKLSDYNIKLILKWIQTGAKNN